MFGDVVRAHRRRLGITQEELASRSGLSVRNIGKLENGVVTSPRPATVRLLANAFGLTGAGREGFCEVAGEVDVSAAAFRLVDRRPTAARAIAGLTQRSGSRRFTARISMLVGYARCSFDGRDHETNRQILLRLGAPGDRIYLDHACCGGEPSRPGLDQALAAVRSGDTLVVPKLARLACSVVDARQIGDLLTARHVRLQVGTLVWDPADSPGQMFFAALAMLAEFELDLHETARKAERDVDLHP